MSPGYVLAARMGLHAFALARSRCATQKVIMALLRTKDCTDSHFAERMCFHYNILLKRLAIASASVEWVKWAL